MQQELSSLENELQLARRYYNGAVRQFNLKIVQFPSNIIAQMFGWTAAPYFEIIKTEERNVPEIKL